MAAPSREEERADARSPCKAADNIFRISLLLPFTHCIPARRKA